jgi:hypothetical protein
LPLDTIWFLARAGLTRKEIAAQINCAPERLEAYWLRQKFWERGREGELGRGKLPAGSRRIAAGGTLELYCNVAYSNFACLKMGISGSASFQSVKKSWYAERDLAVWPCKA